MSRLAQSIETPPSGLHLDSDAQATHIIANTNSAVERCTLIMQH